MLWIALVGGVWAWGVGAGAGRAIRGATRGFASRAGLVVVVVGGGGSSFSAGVRFNASTSDHAKFRLGPRSSSSSSSGGGGGSESSAIRSASPFLASPDPPVPAPAAVLGGEMQTQTEMQAQTHRAFFVAQLVRVACALRVRSLADVEAAMREWGVPWVEGVHGKGGRRVWREMEVMRGCWGVRWRRLGWLRGWDGRDG